MLTNVLMTCAYCDLDISRCDRCDALLQGGENLHCVTSGHYCERCGEVALEEMNEATREQFIKASL